VLTGTTTAGMPTRRFSTAILAGSWPQTDPADCHALATVQQRKAVDLLDNAEDIRSAATQVAATQSGSTVEAFHGTSGDLAATITGHADHYFAMARTSTTCGQILSGLRDDLDQIDAQAHQHIEPLMRSNNPAARAAAIQIIATTRAQAATTGTAAATAITTEGTKSGLAPSSSVQPAGYTIKQDTPTPPPPAPGVIDTQKPPDPNKHHCDAWDITKYAAEGIGGPLGVVGSAIGGIAAAELGPAEWAGGISAVLGSAGMTIDGWKGLVECE
jgi:hypothetical protein